MKKFLLFGLLALPSGNAAAGSFTLAPATSTALLGAPVEITGSVLVPGKASLTLAQKSTGPFEILEASAVPESEEGGKTRLRVRMKAAAFALGSVVLPPLPWTLRTAQGEETLMSPAVPLQVIAPYSASEAQDILDIRGPLSPSPWPWLLALGLLLSAGLWAWEHRRRTLSKPAGMSASPEESDGRSAEEIALDALDALLQDESLPVKDFYDGVSDVLRAYLERRYGLTALQMTTHDLLRALLRMEHAPAGLRPGLKSLLDRCDLAKFARFAPSFEDRRTDADSAKDLVRSSAPKEEHPPEEAKIA
ncbi:MAG: hypothetical protein WCU88_04355 [Elusimicrobiota bacterium]|jgi:hypothetical protein